MSRTIFRDIVLIMVLAFVAMVIWMLPHLNPPAKNAEADPPGNVIVHATWPKGDTDVDLWVYGPGEPRPVGYSNTGGVLWNLLRDDLGARPDATELNYENAYTRGTPAGEYVINVHCYRCPKLPQRIDIEVSSKSDSSNKGSLETIATTSLELKANGQERTALRFKLDDQGRLERDSLHHAFMPLRAWQGES